MPSATVIGPLWMPGAEVSRSTVDGVSVWPLPGLSLLSTVSVTGVAGAVEPLSSCASGNVPPVTTTVMVA